MLRALGVAREPMTAARRKVSRSLRSFIAWIAVLSGIGACGALLVPSRASAYEGQLTLGAEVGYAQVLGQTDLSRRAVTVGAASSIGINDVISLRGRLAYGYHPAGDSVHVGVGGVEALYLVDVLEVVPYFGLGAGAIFTARDAGYGIDVAGHGVIGLEWLASWDWLLGIDVRPYVLPLHLNEAGVEPVYFTVSVRASLIFDL